MKCSQAQGTGKAVLATAIMSALSHPLWVCDLRSLNAPGARPAQRVGVMPAGSSSKRGGLTGGLGPSSDCPQGHHLHVPIGPMCDVHTGLCVSLGDSVSLWLAACVSISSSF